MEYPATISAHGSCQRPPRNVNFFINAVLHITILLVIVSSFFFLFVSKLSKDKFKQELTDLVNQNLTSALINSDKDQALKTALQAINLDQITTYYENRKDAEMQTQNRWLVRVVVMAVIMLIFTIFLSIFIIKQSCGQCTPFTHILKENIILFFFVGLVEVSFFLMVARKFVPTKPSLMMETIIASLKQNFST